MSQGEIQYYRPMSRLLIWGARALGSVAVALVTYQSLRPTYPSITVTHFDKLMHLIAYAILTGLFAQAFPKMRLLYIFFWPALYGAVIEVSQAAMPYGRTGSWADLIANSLGGVLVILLWIALVKVKNRDRDPIKNK